MEETPTPPTQPAPPSRRRSWMFIAAGAVLALGVAFVAGIPFGAADSTHETDAEHAAGSESEAVFPPKLEAEARSAVQSGHAAENTQASATTQQGAVHESAVPAAHAVSGAAQHNGAAVPEAVRAHDVAPKNLAAEFAAAVHGEASGAADESARRLRALVQETDNATLRRVILLTLAGMERRLGHGPVADAVQAEAERGAPRLDGAALLGFARECLHAGAPDVARRLLARFSLAASECADQELAGLITVCRLQAEACEAEWRRTVPAQPADEQLPRFEGATR